MEKLIAEFVDRRIESMLRCPPVWGGHMAVETGIFLLLEIRHLLVDPENKIPSSRHFCEFMKRELPWATPEPLCVQLGKEQRINDFSPLMRKFVDEYIATFCKPRNEH